MKYIKAYEVKREPQIGDYVVLLDMYNPPKEKDVIGIITKIDDVEQTENWEDIKIGDIKKFYTVVELNDSNTEHSLEIDEIDFFSSNIDECKMLINTRKYNL